MLFTQGSGWAAQAVLRMLIPFALVFLLPSAWGAVLVTGHAFFSKSPDLAFSSSGFPPWLSIGQGVFDIVGNGACHSSSLRRWVITGNGKFQLAYANDTANVVGIPFKFHNGNNCHFENGVFVAVGNSGVGGKDSVAISADGMSFRGVGRVFETALAKSDSVQDVAFARRRNQWVVVGQSINATGANVAVSTDFMMWTIFTTPMKVLNSITFSNSLNLWIVCGKACFDWQTCTGATLAYATDVSSGFTQGNGALFPSSCGDVLFAFGRFFAVFDQTPNMLTSLDGVNWQKSADPIISSLGFGGIDYLEQNVNTQALVVAAGFVINTNSSSRIVVSTDGQNWTVVDSGRWQMGSGVSAGNPEPLVVGTGAVSNGNSIVPSQSVVQVNSDLIVNGDLNILDQADMVLGASLVVNGNFVVQSSLQLEAGSVHNIANVVAIVPSVSPLRINVAPPLSSPVTTVISYKGISGSFRLVSVVGGSSSCSYSSSVVYGSTSLSVTVTPSCGDLSTGAVAGIAVGCIVASVAAAIAIGIATKSAIAASTKAQASMLKHEALADAGPYKKL
jgi:hypothetical protein